MDDCRELIPPPPVVRDRLAENIRERRLLRSLLRLAIQAAEQRRQEPPFPPRPEADGRGVDR